MTNFHLLMKGILFVFMLISLCQYSNLWGKLKYFSRGKDMKIVHSLIFPTENFIEHFIIFGNVK